MTLPAMRSLQLPAPDRRSTPTTLRAFVGPFVMTRTMDVAPTPSSTRHAWARGNGPVGVQMATSTSPVRLERLMPTRSMSRSWLPARYPSAPETFFTILDAGPLAGVSSSGNSSTLTTVVPSAACMPSVALRPFFTNASSALLR